MSENEDFQMEEMSVDINEECEKLEAEAEADSDKVSQLQTDSPKVKDKKNNEIQRLVTRLKNASDKEDVGGLAYMMSNSSTRRAATIEMIVILEEIRSHLDAEPVGVTEKQLKKLSDKEIAQIISDSADNRYYEELLTRSNEARELLRNYLNDDDFARHLVQGTSPYENPDDVAPARTARKKAVGKLRGVVRNTVSMAGKGTGALYRGTKKAIKKTVFWGPVAAIGVTASAVGYELAEQAYPETMSGVSEFMSDYAPEIIESNARKLSDTKLAFGVAAVGEWGACALTKAYENAAPHTTDHVAAQNFPSKRVVGAMQPDDIAQFLNVEEGAKLSKRGPSEDGRYDMFVIESGEHKGSAVYILTSKLDQLTDLIKCDGVSARFNEKVAQKEVGDAAPVVNEHSGVTPRGAHPTAVSL